MSNAIDSRLIPPGHVHCPECGGIGYNLSLMAMGFNMLCPLCNGYGHVSEERAKVWEEVR